MRQAALRQRRVERGDAEREDALGTLKIELGLQLGGRFESSSSQSPLRITPSSRRFRRQVGRERMRPGSVQLGAVDIDAMDLGAINGERCCGERHD